MGSTQRPVPKNRRSLRQRGLLRVELQASPADASLLRSVALMLRTNPVAAARVRRLLGEAVDSQYQGLNFKEFLEAAPLEGVKLTRGKDLPREVEL